MHMMTNEDLIDLLGKIAAEMSHTDLTPEIALRQLRSDPSGAPALLRRVEELNSRIQDSTSRNLRLAASNDELRNENNRLCRAIAMMTLEAREERTRTSEDE